MKIFRFATFCTISWLLIVLALAGCRNGQAPEIPQDNKVENKGDTMEIKNGSKVSIGYKLTVDGKIVDQSQAGQPLVYVQGGKQIISGLEDELSGLKKGDKKSVTVAPAKGYGEKIPTLVHKVPKTAFGETKDLKAGEVVSGKVNGQEFQAVVAEVGNDFIMLDLNHPLAGKTLNFDVEIVDVQ